MIEWQMLLLKALNVGKHCLEHSPVWIWPKDMGQCETSQHRLSWSKLEELHDKKTAHQALSRVQGHVECLP